MLRFPIDRRAHERIVRALAAHSMGEAAVDPLTGRSVPPPLRGSAGGDDYVDDARAWGLSIRSAPPSPRPPPPPSSAAAPRPPRLAGGPRAAAAAPRSPPSGREARCCAARSRRRRSRRSPSSARARRRGRPCAGYQCLRGDAAAALAADPRAVAAAPAHVAQSAWLS